MVGMPRTKAKPAKSVRAATLDDLRPIMGIYNWAVNQTFATIDSEPLDAEEAQDWWEMHGRRSKLVVAVDDTGVIGWARLLPWKQRGADRDDPRSAWPGLPDDRREHRKGQPRGPGPVHKAWLRNGRNDPQRSPQIRPLDGHHPGGKSAGLNQGFLPLPL